MSNDMKKDLRRIARMMVLKKLVCKDHYLNALHDYLSNRLSPSEVEALYHVGRSAIRGIMARIGSSLAIRMFALGIIEAVMEMDIQCLVELRGLTRFVCFLCEKEFNNVFPEDHMLKRHRELVERYVDEAIKKLMSKKTNPLTSRVVVNA
jgi:hypothetical protein